MHDFSENEFFMKRMQSEGTQRKVGWGWGMRKIQQQAVACVLFAEVSFGKRRDDFQGDKVLRESFKANNREKLRMAEIESEALSIRRSILRLNYSGQRCLKATFACFKVQISCSKKG